MPLQKQAVDVPLGVGLDQKTDDIFAAAGKLLDSQNTRVQKVGEIRPRKGITTLNHTSASTIGITSIADINGDRVYTTSENLLYRMSDQTQLGPVSPCTIQSFGVMTSAYRVVQVDTAYLSSTNQVLVAHLIETGAAGSGVGDVVYQYLDGTTLTPVCAPTRVTTSNNVAGLRALSRADAGYIVFSKSDLTLYGTSVSADGTYTAPTAINTYANAPVWDLHSSGAYAYGIVGDGTTLYVVKIGLGSWTYTSGTITAGAVVTTVHKCAAHCSAAYLFLAYNCTFSGPTTYTRMIVYDFTLAVVTSSFTLTSHSGQAYSIGIGPTPTANVVCVASSNVTPASALYETRASQVTSAGTISGYMYNIGCVISGKPYSNAYRTYIPAKLVDYLNTYGSGVLLDFQSTGATYAVMAPAGIWLPRLLSVYYASTPMTCQDTPATTAGKVLTQVITADGYVSGHALDFSDRTRHLGCQNGALYYIGGSLPMVYDGQRPTELLPLQVPRLPSANVADGGGSGALSAGNYAYVITYRWKDTQGVVYESAPSPTTEGTITGLAASHKVTLTIPCLTCSMRETYSSTSNFQQAEIYIYRTVANGSVYYLAGKTQNVVSSLTTSYTDNTSDATLVTQAVLYTQGGAVGNDFPSYATAITPYRGRMVIAAGSTLWVSKYIGYKEAASFADLQTIELATQGRVTALFVIDDKLMISTASAVYMIAGDGPNDAAQQSDYPDPARVAADVGVVNSKAVIVGPFGALLGTSKGLYKIDRGLNVTYEGSEVETVWGNNSTILASCLSPTGNRVHFSVTDNANSAAVIVFDYALDVWSYDVITDPTSALAAKVDALVELSGSIYYGTRTGYIGYEASAARNDWGSKAYQVSFTTPWVRVGGIAGYQRLWRATLTGYQYDLSNVTVYLGVDYSASYETARGWTSGDLSGVTRMQLSVKPTKQKIQAARLQVIAGADTGSGIYPPWTFSAVTWELGMKSAARRLPAGKIK